MSLPIPGQQTAPPTPDGSELVGAAAGAAQQQAAVAGTAAAGTAASETIEDRIARLESRVTVIEQDHIDHVTALLQQFDDHIDHVMTALRQQLDDAGLLREQPAAEAATPVLRQE